MVSETWTQAWTDDEDAIMVVKKMVRDELELGLATIKISSKLKSY